MKNFIKSLTDKVNKVRHKDYKILDTNTSSRTLCMEEDTMNVGFLDTDFLVIQNGARFINKGKIAGVVIVQNTVFKNYGEINGALYCRNGRYNARKESKTIGFIVCKELVMQPGAVFDGEITLGNGTSTDELFIEAVKMKYNALKTERILEALT